MKKTTYILIIIILTQVARAQIHEIGVFAGGSNYVGDVGKTNYIDPNNLALGLVYKWNKNPRYSWRFGMSFSKLEGNDEFSNNSARKNRNLSFTNNITEFSAGFEFNWFDFNLHKPGKVITPFVYTGVSYFTSQKLYVKDRKYFSSGSTGTFAIPIIAGVKMKITDYFVIGIESGIRYTFTDGIDGSFPKDQEFQNYGFGNINSKDWFTFTGLTFTYTFGDKPCYCNDN